MRVAVVGAGLAGLSCAAALHRSGHEVVVYEQAAQLRASGLALNLWSNATSVLPQFGIAPTDIPGEPFSRMVLRARGRQVAEIALPAVGLPHVNVDRGELLTALAATLPPDSLSFGARQDDTHSLAAAYDLVVVADGANSTLRTQVVPAPRNRWSWTVWQASAEAELPEIPANAGASVTQPGLFAGIWRLPRGLITWFVEQPGRASGAGPEILRELAEDEDPVLRTLAAATDPETWIEWRTEDIWPARVLHQRNVVLVGDAAHAMLPTLGQGACQSLEDAAVLVQALTAHSDLETALRRYEATRATRTRWIVGLARAGAISRRPNPVMKGLPATASARLMAVTGGPILRRLTRPTAGRAGVTTGRDRFRATAQ